MVCHREGYSVDQRLPTVLSRHHFQSPRSHNSLNVGSAFHSFFRHLQLRHTAPRGNLQGDGGR